MEINQKEGKNKFCLLCGKELKKTQKKFCSSSCSAKFNNVGRKHSEETKRKISKSLVKANNVVVRKEKCLNCDTELKITQKKYCSIECQHDYEYKKRVEQWKNNPVLFNSEYTPPFIKRYLMLKYDNKCQQCGWGEKNQTTGNIPLQLHHIDGDCTNNNEDNLELLCPNCHSLTSNYGSLNELSKRYKLKNYKQLN